MPETEGNEKEGEKLWGDSLHHNFNKGITDCADVSVVIPLVAVSMYETSLSYFKGESRMRF